MRRMMRLTKRAIGGLRAVQLSPPTTALATSPIGRRPVDVPQDLPDALAIARTIVAATPSSTQFARDVARFELRLSTLD
jgi:hypothetical protein